MIIRLFCIGLIDLFFFSGCAAKKELLNEIDSKIVSYGNSMLCGQIQNVQVFDKRDGVVYDNLDIPKISWPGRKDEVRLPLTQQLEQLILHDITSRSWKNGTSYFLNVNFLEGIRSYLEIGKRIC